MIFLVTMLLSSIVATWPISFGSTFSPTETLWGAGAKWAANGGTKAAYVSYYDNLVAHPDLGNATDYLSRKEEVSFILDEEGFTVDTFGDMPPNLSQYSLVVLEAYFACEPVYAPAVKSYVSNGGGVLFCGGAIAYLAQYSKNMSVGWDLSGVADWFGASYYFNSGGTAHVIVPNPLGTGLSAGETLEIHRGFDAAATGYMNADSQVLAVWEWGSPFSFTHTYGQGRVYWQSEITNEFPQQPWTLIISYSPLGTISPWGKVSVPAGSAQSVTASPFGGYQVSNWYLDGVAQNSTVTTFTVSAQMAGTTHTLQVQFSTITPGPTSTFLISPAVEPSSVNDNFTVTVNLTNAQNMVAWQVVLVYSGAFLRCNDLWIPDDNVFAGHDVDLLPSFPSFYPDFYDGYSSSFIGSELVNAYRGDSVNVDSGVLFKANFTVMSNGSSAIVVAVESYPLYSSWGVYWPSVWLNITSSFGQEYLGSQCVVLTESPLAGDVNGDFKVDVRDVTAATRAFGTVPGDLRWNPRADINGDGKIDIRDIAFISKKFGQHYP